MHILTTHIELDRIPHGSWSAKAAETIPLDKSTRSFCGYGWLCIRLRQDGGQHLRARSDTQNAYALRVTNDSTCRSRCTSRYFYRIYHGEEQSESVRKVLELSPSVVVPCAGHRTSHYQPCHRLARAQRCTPRTLLSDDICGLVEQDARHRRTFLIDASGGQANGVCA